MKQVAILEGGLVRDATNEELQEISFRFLFAMCIRQLRKLGIEDDEIRDAVSISLRDLSDRSEKPS